MSEICLIFDSTHPIVSIISIVIYCSNTVVIVTNFYYAVPQRTWKCKLNSWAARARGDKGSFRVVMGNPVAGKKGRTRDKGSRTITWTVAW